MGKKARKTMPAPAATPDPFDERPTYAVMRGPYRDDQMAHCIVFERTETEVRVVMQSPDVHVTAFNTSHFDAKFTPALPPLGSDGLYPYRRAVGHFLGTHRVISVQALRVLRNLRDGKPPEDGPLPVVEQPTVDPFDETPTLRKPRRSRVRRQPATTAERKAKRRAARQARLAKLSPTDLAAWKAKRKARRAELRALKVETRAK